ncbi:UNC5C-like protein isoform X2 [Glandiceps talaboti]
MADTEEVEEFGIRGYRSISVTRRSFRRRARSVPTSLAFGLKGRRADESKDELPSIENFSWYVGYCPASEAEELLNLENKNGCFIVRKEKQNYVLSVFRKPKGHRTLLRKSVGKTKKPKIEHYILNIDCKETPMRHSMYVNEELNIGLYIKELQSRGDKAANVKKLSRSPNEQLLKELKQKLNAISLDEEMVMLRPDRLRPTVPVYSEIMESEKRGIDIQKIGDELLLNRKDKMEIQKDVMLPNKGVFSIITLDHHGTSIEVPNTGVTLVVPQNAVNEGQTKTVYIGVSWQEKDREVWTDYGRKISPTVACGPVDTLFNVPVVISFPHCIRGCQGKVDEFFTVLKSETGIDERTEWEKAPITDKDHPDKDIYANVVENRCLIFTRHFTKFTCTCNLLNGSHEFMSLCVMSYHSKLIPGGDLKLRIYIGDNNQDNTAYIKQEESTLDGIQCDSKKLIRLHGNAENVNIVLSNISEGWGCLGARHKVMSYYSLWSENCIDSKSFLLEPKDSHQSKCHCIINVCQGNFEQDKEAEICLSVMLNQHNNNTGCGVAEADVTSTSTTLPKQNNKTTRQILEPSKLDQSYEVNRELEVQLLLLLDPPHPTHVDWKMLASKMELSSTDINYIGKSDSPTTALLQIFRSRKIPVSAWCAKLREMGRFDAVSLLEKHYGDFNANTA